MVVRGGLREISHENKEQLSAVLARGQSLLQQKYLSSPRDLHAQQKAAT